MEANIKSLNGDPDLISAFLKKNDNSIRGDTSTLPGFLATIESTGQTPLELRWREDYLDGGIF